MTRRRVRVCSKSHICQDITIPLTKKHLAIPFARDVQSRTMHIGATVSFNGAVMPGLKAKEQTVVVIGKRRRLV